MEAVQIVLRGIYICESAALIYILFRVPPLDCGVGTRGAAYCDPHVWPPYQMGAMSAAGWNGVPSSVWGSRGREQSRRSFGFPSIKGSQLVQNQMCLPESRSTPYRVYDGATFSGSPAGTAGTGLAGSMNGMRCSGSELAGGLTCERPRRIEAPPPEVARADPPDEKRAAAVVPLPAFQQAFGSTEIGRFAEAFSRAEAALEEEGATNDAFAFEAFGEWEPPAETWSPPPPPATPREIKCEDPY
ncbi:hypothetical protein EVAR_7648_1 [Eumeta japonica]|uniref:Uncharacterized protein n=1 Tax=Eumeta variegata TaxID=151549 RepID=A0A4C1TI97_EUMVA|nr:hypothetical protein EVAR_7648_1 [Eumeta japonica]